jgi:hypothetical protein
MVKQKCGRFTNASCVCEFVSYSIGRNDSTLQSRASLIRGLFDGQGGFTGTLDENNFGVPLSQPGSGTLSMDADGLGHGVITIPGVKPTQIYMFGTNKAFAIEGDENNPSSTVQAGMLEPQSVMTIEGTYTMGWYDNMAPIASWPNGVLKFAPDGTVTGYFDQQLPDGTLKGDQPFTGTLALGADGRGFITISDTEKWAVDVISPTKFVAIPFGGADQNGAVLIFEK